MKTPRLAFVLALLQLPAILSADFTLTILHFNDAESHLLSVGDPEIDPATVPTANASDLVNYGGAARFVTVMNDARKNAATDAVIEISAGDNFLPSLALDASNPNLNAANTRSVNYDALTFAYAHVDLTIPGNHDFDAGPDYFAGFIDAVHADGCAMKTVSCNIDASATPTLAKDIAPSAVFEFKGEKIGVVGATTWLLPDISSPGSVKLIDADKDGDCDIDDAAICVQKEIDRLTKEGVNKIILVAHLQSVRNDQALLRKLRGVDVEISGGGHELLATGPYDAIPGATTPVGNYPHYTDADGKPVTDLSGRNVPVITANCALGYVGRLVVDFDDAGNVLSANGGPMLVSAVGKCAAKPDAATDANVVKPVYAYIHAYGSKVAAVSGVELDGLRTHVRNVETNLGDFVADAILSEGCRQALIYKMPVPDVAVINGGSIRNNSVVPAGNLTNIALKNVIPFTNYVTIVSRVTPKNFKALAEHMVSEAGLAGGCFGQIAGFRMVYNAKAPAGSRVRELTLDSGQVVIADGEIDLNAPTVCFATVNFLARGGDNYPFDAANEFVTPILQNEALRRYASEEMKGKIDAAAYPVGGLGRVVAQ
jgi:5'-nucleotidase / UDP-sugar diphosphatase